MSIHIEEDGRADSAKPPPFDYLQALHSALSSENDPVKR
jgi:hypothetical protein